jgi:hypothetical protein
MKGESAPFESAGAFVRRSCQSFEIVVKLGVIHFDKVSPVKRIGARLDLCCSTRSASRTASLAFWYSPVFTTFSTKASCSSVGLILRVGIAVLPDVGRLYHLWQSLLTSIASVCRTVGPYKSQSVAAFRFGSRSGPRRQSATASAHLHRPWRATLRRSELPRRLLPNRYQIRDRTLRSILPCVYRKLCPS